MKVPETIKNRLQEIEKEVMALVGNQQMSLTEKNRLMKPLVDEKRVLEGTINELKEIETRDYSGRCSDKC